MSQAQETLFTRATEARRERRFEDARTSLTEAESSSRQAGDELALAR